MRASVCASSVFPQPVGPSSRMFDFCSSTSLSVGLPHADALVVVVDRDGERALRLLLRDDVVVQHGVDVARAREVVEVERRRGGELLVDDLVAEIDALVADVDAGAGDQLLDLALALPAEAAEQLLVSLARSGHWSPLLLRFRGFGYPGDLGRRSCGRGQRWTITRSMIPYSCASSEVMK